MYRTVAQLDSATDLLATWFPQHFSRQVLPEASVEGRPVHALRMRVGGGGQRRGVLFLGGTHARELMNPDAIVELAVDLLVSHANGTDVVYGGRTWAADDVRVILEALDLWFVPCVNPDGRHHVMTVDDLWRKNRRDNPRTPCDGVDLNRNHDILWGVAQGQTSCSPCSDVYCGPSAFSEPESRNVKHLLDAERIDVMVDVHSYSELVLWPWGHAPNQTEDPTQRFTGLQRGTCTASIPVGYEEYITPRDLLRFETVGGRVVDAIAAVRGRVYTGQTGIGLYPTTGTTSDYAYARHIADPTLRKTYGFTFEAGPYAGSTAESFHPADPTLVKLDTKAGMLALAQQSVCAIELIGVQLLQRDTEVAALRQVRDELLVTTDAGRQWVALFERVQAPLIGTVLADAHLSREAAALLEAVGGAGGDDPTPLQPDDLERASSFIALLAERTDVEAVNTDIGAVRGSLAQMAGLSLTDAVQLLMRAAPADQRQPVTGS